jgi:hypothetical protein
LIGICPSCGVLLEGEKGKNDDVIKLCSLCDKPDAMPTGVRLLPDQASLIFTDGNMHEYKREEYEKVYGFDPLPVWEAVVSARTGVKDNEIRAGR